MIARVQARPERLEAGIPDIASVAMKAAVSAAVIQAVQAGAADQVGVAPKRALAGLLETLSTLRYLRTSGALAQMEPNTYVAELGPGFATRATSRGRSVDVYRRHNGLDELLDASESVVLEPDGMVTLLNNDRAGRFAKLLSEFSDVVTDEVRDRETELSVAETF